MANRFTLLMFVIASDIDSDWAGVESSDIVSEVHAERQVGNTMAIHVRTQYVCELNMVSTF